VTTFFSAVDLELAWNGLKECCLFLPMDEQMAPNKHRGKIISPQRNFQMDSGIFIVVQI
jgi:hypothetical protein